MQMRLLRALPCAIALLVGVPAAAQETPLEIDAILPMTGQGAFIGKAEQQSLQVIEAVTNASGGIKGRPIKFAVADDTSNPQVAVQLANAVIAKGAPIIVGPGLTAECMAILPLVTRGPFTYCLAPGTHPPVGSFMFSANAGSNDLTHTWLRYMRSRGITRFAFMATTDASGQDIGEQVDEALAMPENKSLQLVSKQVFAPNDFSVNAQIQNIKAARPQALLVAANGSPFGTVLRGVHDAGLEIPVISPSSNMHAEQLAQYTSILPHELVFGSSRGAVYEPQADARVRRAQSAFFDAFRKAGIAVNNGHCVPWDAVSILVDALRHIGPNATAPQIKAYIDGVQNFVGIDGAYDFKAFPQRGVGEGATIMYLWNAAEKTYTIASKPRGER
jgi:branched-chain amino acid transport system substrate-binding protein